MPNQPNRGRDNAAATPTPVQIREAREAAGLTQTQAAHLVYSTLVSWQRWEAGDRRMHPGLWELFRAKSRAPDRDPRPEIPPLPHHLAPTDLAFHSARKERVVEAVKAMIAELGLRNGSVSGPRGSYLAYDLYELLHVYMGDTIARLHIHDIIQASRRRRFKQPE